MLARELKTIPNGTELNFIANRTGIAQLPALCRGSAKNAMGLAIQSPEQMTPLILGFLQRVRLSKLGALPATFFGSHDDLESFHRAVMQCAGIVVLNRIYSEFQKHPNWAFLAFKSLTDSFW